ncbi:MAG: EAL domain-containing protein [Actinomycetota bacterium]|nr:EAL domain-containing protein [Actinomycetota bacterium]
MTGHDRHPGADDTVSAVGSSDALAQEWARVIGTTAYVPMSTAEIHSYLHDLVQRLVAALSGPSVDTRAASDVGARLVAAQFTGPQSLSRTIELLARRLLTPAESIAAADRIVDLLGALVAGYTAALRNHIFDQQEDVKRALIKSWQDSERNRRASEARFDEVFNSSAVGIVISEPGGRIVRTNPSLDEILGYATGELFGRELSELFAPDDLPEMEERYHRLRSGDDAKFRVPFRLRRVDGEPAWTYLAVSALLDADGAAEYLATMVEDFTDQHHLTERLNHQALHDVRTGLPNRQYFISHLEEVLELLESSAVITLLHLDLDGFSAINDGLGQHCGDRLLEEVARRLKSVVADKPAMVARLGCDEFAIVIEAGISTPDVGRLAETINIELAEPFYLDGIGVAVTASIGVVQRQAGRTESAELLGAAAATLHRLQGKGKRQWTMFDADIDAVNRAELRLASAMPGALETGELGVGYEPVVTLEGGRIVGVGVSLSWQHPELGVLPHERCMQVAEQTGAVHAVGQWLLRTAAAEVWSWRQRTGVGLPVLVTLTPFQAQDPDLVAKVKQALEETRLPASELELWVPSDALFTVTGVPAGEGGEQAEDNLRVLAELGLRAGLHDFGGGIGGLRCVAELPVHGVRVARPVAAHVTDDPAGLLSRAVHTFVHTVRDTGIDVVAFPVDTEEQAARWRRVGANWAVGALFGRPGSLEDIEPLLDAQASGE